MVSSPRPQCCLDDPAREALEWWSEHRYPKYLFMWPWGDLIGKPLRALATSFVRHLYRAVGGKLPIIGVGGIFTADDAYEKIRAGASAVQIYTGFIYEGPAAVKRINRGLIRLMERDGFQSISEAVGTDN